MARPVPLSPNARGYIAGLLDFKGNAYYAKRGGLVVYISGVKSESMQKDLKRWIGGGSVTETSSDGDRRGCKTHCDLAHFHYTRTTVKFTFTGLRALCVLYSLEPSLHEWRRKFAEPFHEAMQRIEEISTTKDGKKILDDMAARGWEVP
jgi:hypothetical protein